MLNYNQALRRVYLENLFADQQIKVSSPQRKNTLSKKDIRILLESPSCDKETTSGKLNRLILIIGLTLGVRITEMMNLTLD